MTTLIELAERCEKATGPDRELDVLIWAELDGRDVRERGQSLLAKSRKLPHDECLLGWIDPGKKSRNFSAAVAGTGFALYTASIDAAVSLCARVLPDFHVTVTGVNKAWSARIGSTADLAVPLSIWANAASPAIALCAAILRALDSQRHG